MKYKSKICLWVTLILFLIITFVGFYYFKNTNYNIEIIEKVYDGTLYIYNEKITNENVVVHYRSDHSSYAELPFIEILKELGYDINWLDDNMAEITSENKKYILDIANFSLKEAGSKINLFNLIVGGNKPTIIPLDKELVLDSDRIRCAINHMGKNIFIELDHDNSRVNIVDSNVTPQDVQDLIDKYSY